MNEFGPERQESLLPCISLTSDQLLPGVVCPHCKDALLDDILTDGVIAAFT